MSLPLPVAQPCYFCELIEGKAEPWNVIHKTELTVTMLNGRQYEVGQCMVVSLRHAPTLLDLTEEEAGAAIAAAKRVAGVLVEAYGPDGVLLYQNNGVGSGQEVPHFHLHVVPRRRDSDWGLGPPHIARLEREGRQPLFDHAAVTDAKRQTVAELRCYFR